MGAQARHGSFVEQVRFAQLTPAWLCCSVHNQGELVCVKQESVCLSQCSVWHLRIHFAVITDGSLNTVGGGKIVSLKSPVLKCRIGSNFWWLRLPWHSASQLRTVRDCLQPWLFGSDLRLKPPESPVYWNRPVHSTFPS